MSIITWCTKSKIKWCFILTSRSQPSQIWPDSDRRQNRTVHCNCTASSPWIPTYCKLLTTSALYYQSLMHAVRIYPWTNSVPGRRSTASWAWLSRSNSTLLHSRTSLPARNSLCTVVRQTFGSFPVNEYQMLIERFVCSDFPAESDYSCISLPFTPFWFSRVCFHVCVISVAIVDDNSTPPLLSPYTFFFGWDWQGFAIQVSEQKSTNTYRCTIFQPKRCQNSRERWLQFFVNALFFNKLAHLKQKNPHETDSMALNWKEKKRTKEQIPKTRSRNPFG